LSVTRVSSTTQTPSLLKGQTKTTKGPQDNATQDTQTSVATDPFLVAQLGLNRIIPPALIGNGSGAAPAPVFINLQAFQQNGLAPTFFLGGNSTTPNFRLSSLGGSNLDMPDVDDVVLPLPQVPPPAIEPMPNREVPPARQEPMLQDIPSRDEGIPAILDVEDSSSDVRTKSRTIQAGGLAKALVGVLGVVGAFTLFNGGGFLTRSRSSDEREEFERDRLHAE
jgi:hypothetical protein